MIRLRTPSRLHFGLFAPATSTGRRFGGVGLMIDAPGLELSAEPADTWAVEGPLAERGRAILRQLLETDSQRETVSPLRITVRQAPPEHKGLGTGTQLALGLARLAAEALDWQPMSAEELARRVGRGTRSAIGIHGFASGGFLIDGGRADSTSIAPLVTRMDFPRDWRIVLVLPPWKQGLHGSEELEAFTRLEEGSDGRTAALCRLALLGLLPNLVERNLVDFSEHLYQFNRLAGEFFRLVQGDVYAGPQVAELVHYLRGLGIASVGQSSWGPAVFALTSDDEQAMWLAGRVRDRYAFSADDILITAANNQGACVWKD